VPPERLQDAAVVRSHPVLDHAADEFDEYFRGERTAFSIIVPCHRVVGADGALTGYAGVIEAKR